MKRRNVYARTLAGMLVGSFLAAVILAFAGCPDSAGNCADTLTCIEPAYCIEAGRDSTPDGCEQYRPQEDPNAQDQ